MKQIKKIQKKWTIENFLFQKKQRNPKENKIEKFKKWKKTEK